MSKICVADETVFCNFCTTQVLYECKLKYLRKNSKLLSATSMKLYVVTQN